MGDFFKGRRRKLGLFTFELACVFCSGWMRSLKTFDFVEVNGRPWRYGIESVVGNIRMIRTTPITDATLFDFFSGPSKALAYVKKGDDGSLTLDPAFSFVEEWRMD